MKIENKAMWRHFLVKVNNKILGYSALKFNWIDNKDVLGVAIRMSFRDAFSKGLKEEDAFSFEIVDGAEDLFKGKIQ